MTTPKPRKRTVYVVTYGEYSDYGIEAIFSQRRYAQEYVSAACAGGTIEEWVLDQHAGGRMLQTYGVTINFNTGELIVFEYPGGTRLDTSFSNRRGETRVFSNLNGDFATSTSVVSQEHANKLAVEARQKWLREKAQPK